jgi:uncharacterized membrane protein
MWLGIRIMWYVALTMMVLVGGALFLAPWLVNSSLPGPLNLIASIAALLTTIMLVILLGRFALKDIQVAADKVQREAKTDEVE